MYAKKEDMIREINMHEDRMCSMMPEYAELFNNFARIFKVIVRDVHGYSLEEIAEEAEQHAHPCN